MENDACMSNANIKFRSLTKRSNNDNEKRTGEHIHVTHDTQVKMIIILTK